MRIMLYSQHVLGIGHFFRSMEIARAFCPHKVLFVEGGEPVAGFTPPSHVERLFLPPLMMDAEFSVMETKEGSLEETKAKRKEVLAQAFREFAPDVLITELYPFGRKQFRFELEPILRLIRENHVPARAVCSVRDILVEKKDQAEYEKRVVEILNNHYDLLLVHSDPDVVRLEETFHSITEVHIPIRYTGFVVREASASKKANDRRVIMASSGGGKVGVGLLAASISAIRSIPEEDLELRVFIGPFMSESDRKHLTEVAAKDARIALHPFSLDFLNELAVADLSISMAGYNTCMDILSTGVRAIVYPFPQNREQGMRARKLERLRLLRVLDMPDVEELSRLIRTVLYDAPPPAGRRLNLAGARTSTALVEELQSGADVRAKA